MGVHVMQHREQSPVAVDGFAGWLMSFWRTMSARNAETRRRGREMRVVETLAVGGRKQLLLVSCAGERFLVGTGSDGIGTIVRVRPETATMGFPGTVAEQR